MILAHCSHAHDVMPLILSAGLCGVLLVGGWLCAAAGRKRAHAKRRVRR